jgi:F0F1-type ATP synthase assembly protein I
MKSRTGWAYTLALALVILCAFAGIVVGAFVGNLIAPARLDWSAQSTPGLLFVGAFIGLCCGVALGLWLGVRLVREARSRSAASGGDPIDPTAAKTTRRRRGLVIGTAGGIAILATAVFAAWPRPICNDEERAALVAISPFAGPRVAVRDMPIDEGASAPGGCLVAYTVAAPADRVARYYADALVKLGWANGLAEAGLAGPIETLHEDPYTLWVQGDGWGHGTERWEDLHYGVTVEDLGGGIVQVRASVIKYHCAYC